MTIERSHQIHALFATIAKHSGLVSEAFAGAVTPGGVPSRIAGLEALAKLGVLKPADEESFFINPRLREFIGDHLKTFHAFQALRSVSAAHQQAMAQWKELRRLHATGAATEAMNLQFALDESIHEIAYSVDQNLEMLNVLVSTQYGNVQNLSTKLIQNKYYVKQIVRFLDDLDAIETLSDTIEEEALAAGLLGVRQLVIRRLSSRMLGWSANLKDAQATISKRLFDARQLSDKMKLLADTALFMARNKLGGNWDVHVDENIHPALVARESLPVVPQLDVQSSRANITDAFAQAMAKLPPAVKVSDVVVDEEEGASVMLPEDDDDMDMGFAMPPEFEAVQAFVAEVRAGTEAMSLGAFKERQPALDALTMETWLLYAFAQLAADPALRMELTGEDNADPFKVNEKFSDIVASYHPPEEAEVHV